VKLVSVGEPGSEEAAVLLPGGVLRVSDLDPNGELPRSLRLLLAQDRLSELRQRLVHAPAPTPMHGLRLGPPIVDPSKLVCVGLNYRGHAEEQGKAWPERPLLFCKAANALAGCRDQVELPSEEAKVDYEVELAVVIGRRARRVAAAQAGEHIAGYMVGNDISARRWQKADGQWFRGKNCDGFYPCGPALVTSDELPDWRRLRLRTMIGRDCVQDAYADELIHGVEDLIAFISESMTLEPGDVISTGTPAGVGCWRKPPRFLVAGDEVCCSIDGIGELRNRLVGAVETVG